MNTRIWMLITAVACVVIIALGYFLGIAPKLAEATKADADRTAVEQQNAAYEAQLAALIKQYEGIDEIRAELQELQRSLPPGDGEPDLLDALAGYAAATGVSVASFAQDSPVPYAGEVGAGGTLLGIPIKATLVGPDFRSVMAVVKQLQTGPRLFMVSQFTLSGTEGGFTLDLSGYVYTLTTATIAAPTATPAPEAPAPEETPAPESTEAPAPAPTETTTP